MDSKVTLMAQRLEGEDEWCGLKGGDGVGGGGCCKGGESSLQHPPLIGTLQYKDAHSLLPGCVGSQAERMSLGGANKVDWPER